MTDTRSLPSSPSHAVCGCILAYGLGLFFANTVLTRPLPEFTGVLQAEGQTISADTSGTVTEFLASEGQQVSRGTPLVKLTDPELDRIITAQQNHTRSLQSELAAARERNKTLLAESSSPGIHIRANYVSHADAETVAAEQTLTAAELEIAAIEQRLAAAEINLANSLRQREQLTLISDGYGRVGRFQLQPGDRVAQGERLVRVWDLDRRFAQVSVPSRQMEHIQPGTLLKLTFPDGKAYHGKVASIPLETLRPTHTTSKEDIVSIRVEPAGALWPSVPLGTKLSITLKQ